MMKILRQCFLFAMFSLPFVASAQMPMQDDVIRLQATGEINVKPDIAIVQIAVTTENQNAGQAITANAEKMDQVLAVLKNAIKDESKIQTSRFHLMPISQYDQETRSSEITGYRVTNEVSIESSDIAGLGPLIDNVVAVGSNQIQQLSFSSSELQSYKDQALKQAISNGMAQANMMAEVAGLQVSRIIEISTYMPQMGPMPVYRESGMMMADAQTQLQPGEITVSQQINMTFAVQ
jgi:hypothetical protein